MDSKHGGGIKFKDSRKKAEEFASKDDVFASLNSSVDSEHERGNSSRVTTDSDASVSDAIFALAKTFKSISFHSLSSSDCPSGEDLIQVDPKVILSASAIGSPGDVHPLPKYMKLDLFSDISPKSKHKKGPNAGGNSRVSPHIDKESQFHGKSVIESPPIQVMERPPGFDPNRIPASIFVSKSPGPTDWSFASNESLFSIRIGNNSFSRDHVIKKGEEISKLEEIEISGDVSKSMESEELSKPCEPINSSHPPLAVIEKENEEEDVNMERIISQREEVTAFGTFKDAPMQASIDQWKKAKPPTQELSFKHQANGNGAHTKHVITRKNKKHSLSMCCCTDCTFEFCCSIKLSCCFCKLPSCDCCEWSSCTSCSRSRCSCKWPSFNCSSCGGPCRWPSCDNYRSFKCCKWPSCNDCCSCNCCKWLSCGNCGGCNCCKLPRCGGCGGCKWPSCSCSNCCKLPSCSCSNCCKWPSCNFCDCCKWPSCDCSDYSKWSGWNCSNFCKWPSCNWPNCNCVSTCCKPRSNCCKWPCCGCSLWSGGCCKRPSCSGCSCTFCCGRNFRWKKIFCCLPKALTDGEPRLRHPNTRASRGTRRSS